MVCVLLCLGSPDDKEVLLSKCNGLSAGLVYASARAAYTTISYCVKHHAVHIVLAFYSKLLLEHRVT